MELLTNTIVKGQKADIDEILELTDACGNHLRANGIDQWDENYPNYESILQDLETETLFAYREEGKIIGIVVLNSIQDEEYSELNWSTKETDRNIVVHRLAVHPDHQGKGIARTIMEFAERWAITHNYDAIRLDTYGQNERNQRFYRTRGYTELGKVYLKYKKEFPYYCYEMLL